MHYILVLKDVDYICWLLFLTSLVNVSFKPVRLKLYLLLDFYHKFPRSITSGIRVMCTITQLADFPIQVPRGFGTILSRGFSYLNREITAIFPYHSQLFK
jgi:hypothetical protein